MDRNIVLIGFMGSGKTTVGATLAERLGFSFLDVDKEIERVCGCPIPHIFDRYGEYYFRGIETRITEQAAHLRKTIIATGGGVVKIPTNMEVLANSGLIVYLKTTPEQVYLNTRADHGRPLLDTDDRMETIRALLPIREPLYEKYCDLAVRVPNRSVKEITEEIFHFLLDSVKPSNSL